MSRRVLRAAALVGVVIGALVLVSGAVPVTARAGDDADAAAPQETPDLAPLVWDAVNAPDGVAKAALELLEASPGASWQRVAAILAKGRPRGPDDRPKPLVTDPEAHAAYFEAFPFEPGVVRTYDIGAGQPYWYTYFLPANYDDLDRAPVWFDLGGLPFGGRGTPPPAGWVIVQLSPQLHGAAELGGQPVSFTAGAVGQSIYLSVVADLERRFRVDRDRVFAGGYSRYGNATWALGFHRPDVWAGVVPASGYYPLVERVARNARHVGVLAACGGDRGHKGANDFTRAFHARLTRERVVVSRLVTEKGRAVDGDLEAAAWEWMAARRRDPLPKDVEYTLVDPRHRGAYWIEIVAVAADGGVQEIPIRSLSRARPEVLRLNKKAARLAVEVTGPNAVTVTGRNVKTARLYLSPELFDLTQPLAITRGKTTTVRPRPSISTLVRNYRRDRDHARLFPAVVDLDW